MKLRCGHCQVQMTVPFFALVAFLLLADPSGTAACGILAALLHELGHLCAMHLERRPVQAVRLTAFGAEIRAQTCEGAYWRDACVFLAGPAVNLILFAFLSMHARAFAQPQMLHVFAVANGLLGACNLLPVEPLDGGQALLCALQEKLPRAKAVRIVQITSSLTIVPLAVLGLLTLFRSRWNFTLLLMAVYLLFMLMCKPNRA